MGCGGLPVLRRVRGAKWRECTRRFCFGDGRRGPQTVLGDSNGGESRYSFRTGAPDFLMEATASICAEHARLSII